MKESYVIYNGKIVKEEEVSISIRSKAFNYGLGCFEGIRAYWDEEKEEMFAFRLKDHYDRLKASCKTLWINIPYTSEELCNMTLELLKKNDYRTTTYIRPVAYKGSNMLAPSLYGDDDDRLVIYCQPLGKYAGKEELSVAVSSWTRISDNMLPPRTKATAAYLNSALASLEVLSNGFDEAIFLTKNGYVCEGPGENLFIVKKGKLITPPISDDILEGITRDTVIRLAKEELNMEVIERSVPRCELYAADEMFFSGTAMEVTAVVNVDRRQIGDGKSGPVCKKLKTIFEEMTKGRIPKYMEYLTKIE